MIKNEYFIVVMEEYTNPYDVSPINAEREGLFRSYRDASLFLINEGFEFYAEYCNFTEEFELYYEIPRYMGSEIYFGYIEKWEVK